MSPSEPELRAAPNTIGSDLFHLRVIDPPDLSGVKFVLLCGTRSRAHQIGLQFTRIPIELSRGDRYTLLHAHESVLVASHGIGTGSVDTLLHEVHKLLASFSISQYTLLRIGTCGGVGLSPGRIVITRRALNGLFEPALRMAVLGRERVFEGSLDDALSARLLACADRTLGSTTALEADTMCADTFYIAQGRADGAFFEGSDDERHAFLLECKERGVRNFEMESLPIAAFSKRALVSAAVVSVVLVDRLAHNTPTEDECTLKAHQDRVIELVTRYVKEQVGLV